MKLRKIAKIVIIISPAVATFAALISSYMAYLSWKYNRELFRPSIALTNTPIQLSRAQDKVTVTFRFLLKNVGKETVIITDISLGHFDFQRKWFKEIGQKPVLNPMPSDTIFEYSAHFNMQIDPKIPNEKINDIFPTLVGKHALILKLNYKGAFSKDSIQRKFFLAFQGKTMDFLAEEEYKQIESQIPHEFKVDQ